MEILSEFIKILLPAAIVLYAMYLVVKSFLDKEFERKLIDIKIKNTEIVLPVRLQAYERICLFLERISPNNLVLRLNDGSYSSRQFQQMMVSAIREEYSHNLSQQVYMSDESWTLVKNAMEGIIAIINQAAGELPEDRRSIDLAKKIFEKIIESPHDPVGTALKHLKDEIRKVF